MDNYISLAIRYLKLNKKRTYLTVFGASVAAMILFAVLNMGWSYVLNQRKMLRADKDYDIVFMTETREQINAISADPKVKSASVGQYFYVDYRYYGNDEENAERIYDNALFITVRNPYQTDRIREELSAKYDVMAEDNENLAIWYMQGAETNAGFIFVMFVLLICYIFAIFSIGIVRNSLQLTTLEQIKDYGNLRCIGASKDQLKKIIYLEGFILETYGIVIGTVLGTIATLIVGAVVLHIPAGFHIVPLLPVLLCFYGDLYFVMQENCKVVTNMTPISAIRGEFRIKKEKIKVRHTGFIRKLFGVEGEYAYKTLLRNPGRFLKTVWALGLGGAALIAIVGFGSVTIREVKHMQEQYGYYSIFFKTCDFSPWEEIDQAQSLLPMDVIEEVFKLEGIGEAKKVYESEVCVADEVELFGHYTKDYLKYTSFGHVQERLIDTFGPDGSKKEEQSDKFHLYRLATNLKCAGYDEADLKRYKSVLVDGTVDVSDQGVILVNGGETLKTDSELADNELVAYIYVDYTDYKVGDTITIVDSKEFRLRMQPELEALNREYQEKMAEITPTSEESTFKTDYAVDTQEENAKNDVKDELQKKKMNKVNQIRKELIAEGKVQTFTIEGIVKEDVNSENGDGRVKLIMPLDNYYQFTGTSEDMSVGMQYHFDKFNVTKYQNIVEDSMYEEVDGISYMYSWSSEYPEMMLMLTQLRWALIGLAVFVIFVWMMSSLNVINTTASNLHLRRKEFAQLRVIGLSKKGLMKTVLYEGFISTLFAGVIAVVLGIAISYYVIHLLVTPLTGVVYQPPIVGCIVSILILGGVLCGSIYLPLKGINQDMADDLKESGE